mmetsp:Transcript_2083/g.4664  ORF Transcript_2083/g.4664 Transcript_2083/m.4664 type:complete len:545 (+) Transcript_2083:83-1717(+)|eukprot:CAMPEP_0171111076 /NCGR_PEP_ID=MMETSP0766_2-20121228/73696_1 /TAXON_ID=439317 /ORGANISM="Gambierdiscus australes, Strain CAWD 149" /LENGTH=544 /DNA_ID=CAMNT_0011573019 /DNA_START=71 /DNA_END=1705 /DNA_ORIENTATION=+
MAAQLFAAVLAALLSYVASAAYVEDDFDGNALLQVHGLHDLEVQSSMPQKPIPVWVWEDRGVQPTAIQQACESSWRLHAPARHFEIHFVNRQTISKWLPGLPPAFWRLPSEETKSDVARAGLLAKHGGVYMDYDILLRNELIETLDHLHSADMVSFAANGQSCGKDALSLGFMVARNKSTLATRWHEKQLRLLTTPCNTQDAKVCCSDKTGDLKQCKVAPRALGQHLVKKVLNDVLTAKPDLKVECFEHGKSEGLEDCGAACLSQNLTKATQKLVKRPGMAYKLFADVARQNVSRLDPTQLRQGSSTMSELVRQSVFHKRELYLIHIPRTGGTTIEYLSRLEPYPEDRWGMLNPRVKGLREIGSSGRKCYGQHVPPNFLPVWGNRTTFCVVRDPFDRMVSEYGYSQGIRGNPNCTVKSMNTELLQMLTAVMKGDKYTHDCHLLPQAAYVWGWNETTGKVNTGIRNCEKVLRFEQFEHDFDELMVASGYPHRMEDAHGMLGSSDACDALKVKDLSDEVISAIKKVYKDDFELLFQKGGLGDPERK